MANVCDRPRLFLGNFDFEHRIADPKWKPNETLKRFNAEMAAAWLSVARDGDLIWTPLPFEQDFFNVGRQHGFAKVVPIQLLSEAPRDVECTPWGWTPEILGWAEQFHWHTSAPALNAVRHSNSRRTSSDLEQQWNVGLPGACCIQSTDELSAAIQALDQKMPHWVVKAEFGMSARERILGCGPPGAADINWVQRRLKQSGNVFFEPWVDRVSELGIQIDVPSTGAPTVIGLTPMEVDNRGQYAGSWFAYSKQRFLPLWNEAAEVALRAARSVQSFGYFGPLGVDAMIYRDTNGSFKLRPLQDVNARWTMGRLSLGWKRLTNDAEEGLWNHGTASSWKASSFREPIRSFVTLPATVGSVPCAHQSRVLIWNL